MILVPVGTWPNQELKYHKTKDISFAFTRDLLKLHTITSIELYTCIPGSMTLVHFQGHMSKKNNELYFPVSNVSQLGVCFLC